MPGSVLHLFTPPQITVDLNMAVKVGGMSRLTRMIMMAECTVGCPCTPATGRGGGGGGGEKAGL